MIVTVLDGKIVLKTNDILEKVIVFSFWDEIRARSDAKCPGLNACIFR